MDQGLKNHQETGKTQNPRVLPFDKGQWVVFASTVYGEAANCSPAGWRGVASVILNRVDFGEWKRRGLDSVAKVISKSGFDAYTHPNTPFKQAFAALADSADKYPMGTGSIARVTQVILPFYLGQEDPIPGIVLYYSPKAQKKLHEMNPDMWRSTRPKWNWELLEQVIVPGAEADDLAFFKYKVGK